MAFVQGKKTDQAAGTSLGVTLTSNVTVGNRLIAWVYTYGSGITLSQVADNLGNHGATAGKYDQVVTSADAFNGHIYCMTAPITTGGSCTITATASGSASFLSIWVGEYSGLSTATGSSAWDVTAGSGGTIATSMSTGATGTTGASGELAISAIGDTYTPPGGGQEITKPTGYTERFNDTGPAALNGAATNIPLAVAETTPASGVTVTSIWTSGITDGSNGWAACVAVFTLAGAVTPIPIIGNALPGQAWLRYFKGRQAVTNLPAYPLINGDLPPQLTRRITPQPKPRAKRPTVVFGTTGAFYNASGIKPTVTVVVQRPKPKRGVSAYNNGIGILAVVNPQITIAQVFVPGSGVQPTVTVTVQKKPFPTRPASKWLVPSTSAAVVQGDKPTVTVVIQKPKPRQKSPTVTAGTIGTNFNSGGLVPTLTVVRYQPRKQKTKVSFPVISIYNSGGILPTVTIVRQKRIRPVRIKVVIQPQLLYNSGGFVPTVTNVKQKLRPTFKSPLVVSPVYTSGGIKSIVVRAVQKKQIDRSISRIILQPSTPTPPSQGTQPTVTVIVQKKRPLQKKFFQYINPDLITPPVPGTPPVITKVIQKPKSLQKQPRISPGLFTAPTTNLVTLLVVENPTVTLAPGLFRASGAFGKAIIVQFRTFTLRIMNKVDKTR